MPTLDEIRKRKLDELMQLQQERLRQQSDEQSQIQQKIEYVEGLVKPFLSREALERYGNLKTAHQEKAMQLIFVLYQAIQKGQIQGKIDDPTLKKLLEQLNPKKKEISIKRV
jgi:programmed cell death protein 5